MRYLTILFLLVVLIRSNGHAQDSEEATTPVNPGTLNATRKMSDEDLSNKKFDDDQWRKAVNGVDYNEPDGKQKRKNDKGDKKEKGKSNGRTSQEEGSPEEEEQSSSDSTFDIPISPLVLKIIFYSIVVIVIGLLLYYIAKNTNIRPNPKTQKADLEESTKTVENIEDLDIDAMLRKAHASGNYRLAIRIYFLGLLKKLNENGLIVWKKDKTNRDYLTELYIKERYYQEVKRLTLAYEETWYGDHIIQGEAFEKLRNEFTAIDQQLKTSAIQ